MTWAPVLPENGKNPLARRILLEEQEVRVDADHMLDIYLQKCKLTKREIQKKLDEKQEWYMTAEEAVEHGFADKVYA